MGSGPHQILDSGNDPIAVTSIGGLASTQSLAEIPLTTADGSTTGRVVVPVLVAAGSVTSVPTGASSAASGQVAVDTTADLVANLRATRRSITVKNLSATITAYIGSTNGVTTANGMELKPGESISIDFTGTIYGITGSSNATIAYLESYD